MRSLSLSYIIVIVWLCLFMFLLDVRISVTMEEIYTINDLLPSNYVFRILKSKFNSRENFSCLLRIKIFDVDDFKKWLSDFSDVTNTSWNVRKSKCTDSSRFAFSRDYECHHSAHRKQKVEGGIQNKNKKCEAKIRARIKRNTKDVRYNDAFAKDGYLGILNINFVHSHEINNAEALKWLKRSVNLKDVFMSYFKKGFSPAEAIRYHEDSVIQKKIENLANRRINPPKSWVYQIYSKWLKENCGTFLQQRELAAQREADLLNNDVLEVLQNILQEIAPIPNSQQKSNVLNNPLHRASHSASTSDVSINASTDINISHATSSVSRNINYLQVAPKPVKNILPKRVPIVEEVAVRGRRIISFEFFLNSLKSLNRHSNFNCNLNDMVVTNEVQKGLYTSFQLNCTACGFKKIIHSESPSRKKILNTDFVDYMLSIRRGFTVANNLLRKLNLPLLDHTLFTTEYGKILKKKKKKEANKALKKDPKKIQKTVNQSATIEPLLENVDLSDLLVEEQFEIKQEENIENDFEFILPGETAMETNEDELVKNNEPESINKTVIKQEIDSSEENEDLTVANTCTLETLDKEKPIDCDRSEFQQKNIRTYSKRKNIFQEQAKLPKTPVIQNTPDGSNLVSMRINKTLLNQNSCEIHNPPEVDIPLKKSRTVTVKNRAVINKKKIGTGKKEAKQKLCAVKDCEKLDSSKVSNENVLSCHVVESGKKITDQQLSKSETNRSVTTATLAGASQIPHNLANRTHAAFIPVTSATIQQKTSESSSDRLPLVTQHSSSVNICSTSNQNPIAVLPGAPVSIPPATPIIIQRQIRPLVTQCPPLVFNYSNPSQNPLVVIPGVSRAAYVSPTQPPIQRLANFSSNFSVSPNCHASRLIGQGNVIGNNQPVLLVRRVPNQIINPIIPDQPHTDQSHQKSESS